MDTYYTEDNCFKVSFPPDTKPFRAKVGDQQKAQLVESLLREEFDPNNRFNEATSLIFVEEKSRGVYKIYFDVVKRVNYVMLFVDDNIPIPDVIKKVSSFNGFPVEIEYTPIVN